MYSTIKKKKCKCGECDKFPTLGYNGYFSAHAPQEIKDKVGTKREVAQRNRNARNKVRVFVSQSEETENKNLLDSECI